MRLNKNTSTILSMVSIILAIITVGLSIYTTKKLKRKLQYLTIQNNYSSDKLSAILKVLKTSYVDNVDMDSIGEEFIPKILEKLDPHSIYIPKQEYAQMNEYIDGEFDGIGITFNMMTDTIVVLSVIPGGPSAQAGIMLGDRILTIDGENVAGVKADQEEIVKKLRGKRGSKVELGIERNLLDNPIKITITRGIIPITSIDCAFNIDSNTAYIKLARFSKNAHHEFLSKFLEIERQNGKPIENLIFDLRGNTGGRLDQAIFIANEFFEKDKLIVYTEGAHFKRLEQLSDGHGRMKKLNVKVLINEHSASASEIVAGALQDNDRGTIIGRRSFGKGLVQNQLPFRDGSALRLTVARYYTPLGRSIQKPYDKGKEEYDKDLYNRYVHNEMLSADSIRFSDTTKYVTPKGKVLYGGGGIMPDIFVPADTISGVFMKKVFYTNAVLRYSLKWADSHRQELNNIKTFEDLDQYFQKYDEQIERDFLKFIANDIHKIVPTQQELNENRSVLRCELRALIGRNTILEDNAVTYLLIDNDSTLKCAIESIKNDSETATKPKSE